MSRKGDEFIAEEDEEDGSWGMSELSQLVQPNAQVCRLPTMISQTITVTLLRTCPWTCECRVCVLAVQDALGCVTSYGM